MTLDSVLTGIVTGVVASIIIIVMQTIFDYIKRKKYEMFHFYEFDSFDILIHEKWVFCCRKNATIAEMLPN